MREKARINFQIITAGAEAKGRAEEIAALFDLPVVEVISSLNS